ncbi:MAG: hypothetical protein ACTSPY_02430 [Candidatus Helarchaeota archaeon]
MSKRQPKKSWKQKIKESEELKKKDYEKKQIEESEFLQVLNRVRNAVYIIIIIIILGMILFFPNIYALILFITIGIVALFLIYWPVAKEIEKRKKRWK